MAVETTLARLERVQTAIAAIEEGAQSYSLEGKSLSRGDLEMLYKREERLRQQYYAENRRSTGGSINRIRFDDRG